MLGAAGILETKERYLPGHDSGEAGAKGRNARCGEPLAAGRKGDGGAPEQAISGQRAEEMARDVVVEAPVVAATELCFRGRRHRRYRGVVPRVVAPLCVPGFRVSDQGTYKEKLYMALC